MNVTLARNFPTQMVKFSSARLISLVMSLPPDNILIPAIVRLVPPLSFEDDGLRTEIVESTVASSVW